MSPKDYEIREARQDEKPHLDWLLRDHFYPNEIMQTSFLEANADSMDSESRRLFRQHLLERHMKFIAENPCLVAVHRASDRVVGLCLLTLIDNPNDPKCDREKTPSSYASVGNDDATKTWLERFIDLVYKYDPFEVHPEVRNSLEIKCLIVIEEHRRQGLAERLIKAAVELAKSRNIGMVESLFTSPYTIRVAEKLGFISYADDDIATMKDSYGNLAFSGTNSYVISAMAMKLQ